MVWEVRNGGADTNGGGFRGGANLATPAAPAVTPSASGGAVAAGTYYAVVTLTDGNGETPKSAQTAVTTSGGTASFTVTAPANPGVQGSTWNVYVGTASGGPYFSQGTGLAFGANRAVTATPPTSGTQAPGVDYSQQSGAQVVIDNAAVTATTTGANSNTLTFTGGYTPTAADVGNTVRLTGGTNITVGTYEITGWTATTWTLAGAANATGAGGAGAAVTGNMGGALATPGMAAGLAVTGNGLFIKYNASPYLCSGSSNVPGGSVSTSSPAYIVGYDVTRDRNNADANRPTLAANANSMTVISYSKGAPARLNNLAADANGKTSVKGFSVSSGPTTICRCKASGCTNDGFTVSAGGLAFGCEAAACGHGFNVTSGSMLFVGCKASGGPSDGFHLNGSAQAVWCVAAGNTGRGLAVAGTGNVFTNCTAYGNTASGCFVGASGPAGSFVNCVSYGNGNFGFEGPNPGTTVDMALNCAGGNNANGNFYSGWHAAGIQNFVTLTADPFANAAGNDFSLNTAAGGGAALRAAGFPSSFPGLSTTSYPDVGAAQSAALTSTDPGVANVKAGTTYTINGASLTGTLSAGGSRGQAGRRSFG